MGNVVAVDTYRIRYLMKKKRITTKEIAVEAGITPSYVRQLIKGYVPMIWEPRFEAIAEALGVPMSEIVTEHVRKRA
jgi:Predicted transcriptional regulators